MLIMGCNSHNQFVFKTMRTPVKVDVNVHNTSMSSFLLTLFGIKLDLASPGRKSEIPPHQMSKTPTGVLRVAIAPKMILRITDDPTIYLKLFDENQLADVLLPQGGHAALPGAERGTEA